MRERERREKKERRERKKREAVMEKDELVGSKN